MAYHLAPAWLALALSWPMAVGPAERSAYVPADRSPGPGDSRVINEPPPGWPMAQPQGPWHPAPTACLVAEPGPDAWIGELTPLTVTSGDTPGIFSDLPGLECPDGTKQVDRPPQYGSWYERWCERPDGQRHGPTTVWHANAALAIEGNYENGKEAGEWTHWHETGERKARHTYVDGLAHGVWREWHTNGRLAQVIHYRRGQYHGMNTRWYANGQVFVATRYVAGRIADGLHAFYYENGGLLERGPYVGGQRHGTWTTYHPEGQVTGRERWVRGVVMPRI